MFSLATATLLLPTAGLAQEYYVSVENGSDSNDGSASAPWKTVTWALTGDHSPLRPESTIFLVQSDQFKYGWDSGEQFPWVLSRNVSLVGLKGPNGEMPIVSGHGKDVSFMMHIDPEENCTESEIRCLEFEPRRKLLLLSPAAGRVHSPKIIQCHLGGEIYGSPWDSGHSEMGPIIKDCSMSGNIYLYGSPNCLLSPRICRNEFYVPVNTGVYLWCGEGRINAEIIGNSFYQDMDSGAIAIAGKCSEGLVLIAQNVVRGINNVIFDDWSGLRFYWTNAKVKVIGNAFEHMLYGLKIIGCTNWDPDSVIQDNRFESRWGRAVLIESSNRVTLTENWIYSHASSGLEISDSGNCVIKENQIQSSPGQGIIVSEHSFETEVEGNVVAENGGEGIEIGDSCPSTRILGNRILNNGGRGILVASASGQRILNNLIAQNRGGGIEVSDAIGGHPIQIAHNTIADNDSFGIYTLLPASAPAYLSNCIVWGNQSADLVGFSDGQYYFNDIEAGGNAIDGNISVDPKFSAPHLGDYHLSKGSPCIDAGTNDSLFVSMDGDGDPRLVDGDWVLDVITDMGYDEASESRISLDTFGRPIETAVIHIQGPPYARYRVYAAVGIFEPPLADPGGNHVVGLGTVLLDRARIVEYPPLHGNLDIAGNVWLPIEVPAIYQHGWYTSLQAGVRRPGRSIQLTNAVTVQP